ncbi:hypothetical protein GCM10010339_31940 [Streptomyces alanosinicus]|uniref:Uncharacterized protein n=1 Tax=Streptomyces alanosinicus TaxID=68171 RepID=A0A919D288_9ACTN|nr:hypothetical protein GCM10010339_31940 [Streptomyces alanosinicus]
MLEPYDVYQTRAGHGSLGNAGSMLGRAITLRCSREARSLRADAWADGTQKGCLPERHPF